MKRFCTIFVCVAILLCSGVFAEDEDYIIAQPGDSGADVEIVLRKCADFGFIQNIPEGSNEYLPEYEENIMQMEKTLGFVEDGVIHLSEILELETAIGVGSNGPNVKEILEWLFELGYFREILPDPHDLYEEKYKSVVLNVEKKLALNADGILIASEQARIKEEPLTELAVPQNFSVRHNRGTVTVSWSPVKGAVSYTIFRDGNKAETILGKTSWVDEETEMLTTYRYRIIANSYLRESKSTNEESVEIPLIQSITAFTDRHNKTKKTLTVGQPLGEFENLSFGTNNQLKAGQVTVHSLRKQELNNGYIRFILTYTAPAGYLVAVFNPPNGSIFFLNSNQRTSSSKEAVQFDISSADLKNAKNEMTINIVKSDNDRFFISPKIH